MQPFVESLEGSFPVQYFSRSAIEQLRNALDLVVTDLAEVSAFGEELADEAIGVLVGAALPGTLRMGKVHLDLGVPSKQPMFGHFFTPVMGQRQTHLARHGLDA